MHTLAFLEGALSPMHWLIILVVALLIFGRRLPEVGRSLGKGITEFKKGLKDAGEDNSAPAGYSPSEQYPAQPQQPARFQPQPPAQIPGPASARPAQPSAYAPQREVRASRNDLID